MASRHADPLSTPNPAPAPRSSGRAALNHILRFLIITALLVGSLWFAVRDVDWGGLWNAVTEANLFWAVAAGLITMVAHLARAERWRHLIARGKDIRLVNAFSATMIGYFLNNIIPRSGELVRPYVLAKREGRSASELLATVVVERLLDSLTLLVILVGIIFIASDQLTSLLRSIPAFADYEPTDLIVRLGIPVVAIVAFLFIVIGTKLGDRIVELIARVLPERFGSKLRMLFLEFKEGAKFTGGLSGMLSVVFWSGGIWFLYGLSLHFGVLAFGFDTTYGMGIGDSMVLLGVTAVGMAIAPTPGGFGVFHTFCRITLVSLYGVPVDQAVAFAFVIHFAQYMVVMVFGPGFALREGVSFRNAPEKAAEAERAELEAHEDHDVHGTR